MHQYGLALQVSPGAAFDETGLAINITATLATIDSVALGESVGFTINGTLTSTDTSGVVAVIRWTGGSLVAATSSGDITSDTEEGALV